MGVDGYRSGWCCSPPCSRPSPCSGSWTSIETRVKEFYVFVLLLEAGMIGVFFAPRPVPVLRLLGGDADPDVPADRRSGAASAAIYAAVKFFLYTMAGSVLMLVAILVLYHRRQVPDLRA